MTHVNPPEVVFLKEHTAQNCPWVHYIYTITKACEFNVIKTSHLRMQFKFPRCCSQKWSFSKFEGLLELFSEKIRDPKFRKPKPIPRRVLCLQIVHVFPNLFPNLFRMQLREAETVGITHQLVAFAASNYIGRIPWTFLDLSLFHALLWNIGIPRVLKRWC